MNLFILFLVTIGTAIWLPYPDIRKIEMRYPSSYWIFPGDTLKRADTLSLPCIASYILNPNSTYLLLFIDLNVIWDTRLTTVLHWYQPDMKVSDTKTYPCADDNGWLVNTTSSGAEYIAPQPPPFTRHLYLYLVFEQHPDYVFPECFGHIFPQTMDARAGFDLWQFVHAAGLKSEPAAVNYFYVDNDEAATSATTTPPSTGIPTTTWFRSAPCSTRKAKPTGPTYPGHNDGVEKQQIINAM